MSIDFLFYLYIYPPNSQESDRGAIHRASNYPVVLPEYAKIAVCLKFFLFISFKEILMKFKTACQDRQAKENAIKFLSQGHNRKARVGFKPRAC